MGGRIFSRWVVAGMATLLAVVGAGMVQAHGGRQVYAGEAGPYYVQAFAMELSSEQGGLVDYTLSLRAAADRQPVDNAKVTVRAQTPDGLLGPKVANASANVHSVFLPVEAVGLWTVLVSIEGPLGPASIEHEMTPNLSTFTIASGVTQPAKVIALALLAAVILAGSIVTGSSFLRKRKAPATVRR